MEGADAARKDYTSDKISEKRSYQTQQFVTSLYRKGCTTERSSVTSRAITSILLRMVKQLAGESAEKDRSVSTQLQPTSQRTCTHFRNLSKKELDIMFGNRLPLLTNLVKRDYP